MLEKFDLTTAEYDYDDIVFYMNEANIPTDKDTINLPFADDDYLLHVDAIHLVYDLQDGSYCFIAFDDSGISKDFCGIDMAAINWELSEVERGLIEAIAAVYAAEAV